MIMTIEMTMITMMMMMILMIFLPYRSEELGRNPERMLSALYSDKPYQFHEVYHLWDVIISALSLSHCSLPCHYQDGLRFSSRTLLKQHTDEYMERKKLLQKRKSAATREYREWYCTSSQWTSDFNALLSVGATSGSGINKSALAAIGKASSRTEDEEYIVPADEFFTHCPVSREVFERLWDPEEGEFMFPNAARVLVTQDADAGLFKLGQPLQWMDSSEPQLSVRYLIVHKLLVLDQWLDTGKAVTLREAILRYERIGSHKASLLRNAASEDDDDDEVFVLIE